MPAKKNTHQPFLLLPPRILGQLAEQVARIVIERLSKKDKKGKTVLKKTKIENALFLDTSAIIDGRILEVAKQGFMNGTVVIPEFILQELKRIADSPLPLKRTRGRLGLETLSSFKKIKGLKVKITNDDVPSVEIDERLIRIAKHYKGKIITCDYNLNKKASILGIQILNVNELANSLKTSVLPGEELKVKIVQEGKEKGQGVGYLLDGTMVVVEKGQELVGKTVEAVVSRIFQTAAGRMIFTRLKTE